MGLAARQDKRLQHTDSYGRDLYPPLRILKHLLSGITPDTYVHQGTRLSDTRSRIRVCNGFVGVCLTVNRQLFQASTRVRTSYESRYSWRFCLDGISQYLDLSILYC